MPSTASISHFPPKRKYKLRMLAVSTRIGDNTQTTRNRKPTIPVRGHRLVENDYLPLACPAGEPAPLPPGSPAGAAETFLPLRLIISFSAGDMNCPIPPPARRMAATPGPSGLIGIGGGVSVCL